MPTIKLLTFDLDDTLWEMKPVLIEAERRVYRWLEQHCPAITRQMSLRELAMLRWEMAKELSHLHHQISELRITTMASVLKQNGIDTEEARDLAEQAFTVFIDARHEIELFEYAEASLAQLAEHYTLGALTNGNADVFRLPIGQHFSFAFTAEQLNASKPAADHFEQAQRHSGNPGAQRSIHIGDDPVKDIDAAAKLGWHTIWVNKEEKEWEGERQPTRTINCLSQLAEAVQAIEAP